MVVHFERKGGRLALEVDEAEAHGRAVFEARHSYLEVYNETIRDLLVVPEDKGGPAQPRGGLQVKEDVRASRFFVKDLTDKVCSCHSS